MSFIRKNKDQKSQTLVSNLYDNKKYVAHIRTLKEAPKLEITFKKYIK